MPTDDAEFTVQNHFTDRTFSLSSSDKGNAVIQVALPKDAAKAVKWHFVKLEDGGYRITDPKSGNVLTAVKNDGDDEIRIVLRPWKEDDEQIWELQQIDPANAHDVAMAIGLAVDVRSRRWKITATCVGRLTEVHALRLQIVCDKCVADLLP